MFICDGNLLVDTIHVSGNLKIGKRIEAVEYNKSISIHSQFIVKCVIKQ